MATLAPARAEWAHGEEGRKSDVGEWAHEVVWAGEEVEWAHGVVV